MSSSERSNFYSSWLQCGHFDNPTYEDVCRGKTGHTEVVEVEYNPAILSYDELLNVFWNKHNLTASNHQELDVGSQYRSVIFFHTPEQELLARASKEQLENSSRYHKNPIVTEIVPASQFYRTHLGS
ncbi:peptide-methionine (S)-S-oxide reductase MsrA [Nostoc sp. KVJ3]|uniref:peptide-methionine (S)-S-oxide reductase MsrA n=1 Tax=Nostoc sp. KVJ3 TaxID=457945 RepID=UPI002AA2AFCB|nr:peptide-methionine (S)-S-oxide reductase MsrA [Nostoc sp. KVJ3]